MSTGCQLLRPDSGWPYTVLVISDTKGSPKISAEVDKMHINLHGFTHHDWLLFLFIILLCLCLFHHHHHHHHQWSVISQPRWDWLLICIPAGAQTLSWSIGVRGETEGEREWVVSKENLVESKHTFIYYRLKFCLSGVGIQTEWWCFLCSERFGARHMFHLSPIPGVFPVDMFFFQTKIAISSHGKDWSRLWSFAHFPVIFSLRSFKNSKLESNSNRDSIMFFM